LVSKWIDNNFVLVIDSSDECRFSLGLFGCVVLASGVAAAPLTSFNAF